MEGVAHASMLNDGVTPGVLFGLLFNKLEAAVPKQARTANGSYEAFSLKQPGDPLTVAPVVMEMDDGRLVPMVSNKA